MINNIQHKSVIITGLSGFVGSNLKLYLKDSYKIVPLSTRYLPNQQFEINTDVIIHLAGKAHDLKKVSVPQDYYDSNFELTKQLFDAFLISGSSVFIFMSTVKAVADEVKGVLNEDEIPNPKTHYGIAKHQAENYILNKKLPDGKRVFILRPCMIHGPGNKGNLNLLYQLVSRGLPWPLGAFENKRSFLSIENLCFAIRELMENERIPSGIFNVADDDPLSTNELLELLGVSLGKKNRILNLPRKVINSIAKLGDVLRLPLNRERLQKLTENYIVSNEKIVKELGKSFPVKSKEGLLKTFESFKKIKKIKK
ncbi:NAD-dependent epimerase/dehydratase family protein [Flavobacterium sp. S87F.05.LMB.W.Kidney.N]|uniref:NAD-dependent epimerase/dehydratase family protein n=1 Tax=Flavobacterium sp. S87F.05.LMB.W.Kidney.N TaxID=1278758 RepID=UPI0010EE01A6|nr:NAD-dependent epimerase/dehydratase family protein [Flavobacterium sp. S87F.05.LMB.W.Kidney.N]TDX09281.1 nucleoside-diphosphate-sugar epimerase [Flavobacterium sp. S87F.05.LMB.W.Kidney.N]